MKAIVHEDEKLTIKEVETPEITDQDILVRVEAAGINRLDLLQKKGTYPPPLGASEILGVEFSGIIEKIGSAVTKHKVGDPVMCLTGGGGYAEHAVVHEGLAMPLPTALSFEEGAGIPQVFITSYQTLFFIGGLQADEWVLIHAGASGVGTAAIQLAKARKAKIVATAGTEEKLESCLLLGADYAFNYKTSPFAPSIEKTTDGMDLILDINGAEFWEQNLKLLKPGGRLVFVATMGGAEIEKMKISTLMSKWIQLTGTTLRSRPLSYKIKLIEAFSKDFLPLFESQEIKPIINRVFPVEEIEDAHAYMQENRNIGKIIVKMGSNPSNPLSSNSSGP
jgi:tumor protein p53-inducible protein 3